MIRNKVLLKGFAVFFLLEVIFNAVTPAVSWALTSGPTAPEATSFEPVDTTDMVNLSSGDFTYNLPLLEVPGPAGGYPLSLSYHAGIQPNEEASWVGLGFIVSPGAISRNVNGYPDDFKNVVNVDRQFWEGGHRETYNVGISYSIAQTPASVGFGLSFSQDTYRGFGVGGYLEADFKLDITENLGITTGITTGVSPYGGSYTGANYGFGASRVAGKGAMKINAGINYSTGAGFSGGVNMLSQGGTSLGATISSSGVSFRGGLSGARGGSGVVNSRAGNISTRSSSFGIDIPIYTSGFFLSLGYNYTRYWSDETAIVGTSGSLYYPKTKVENFDNRAYDTYALLPTSANIADNPVAEEELGGSFPNYDNYFVTAQGLSGAIRPYTYRGLIFRQNRKIDYAQKYKLKQYAYKDSEYINEKTEFRFINDFSNKFVYSGGEISRDEDPIQVSFNNSHQTGNEDLTGYHDNHLAGSRHIEWYTNREILTSIGKNPKADGFMDCTAEGFDRWNMRQDQIGGYMATNESGVTYHYALPAQSKDEFVYSENVNDDKGKTFNSLSRPEPYAYTWLLTSVTGPDYVDRNDNGKADEGDWGYWVNFTYKKYASDYKWRNPSQGYHSDLDNNFQNYSSGKKETYYLETIQTASHIAVFEKSERIDSREVTNLTDGGFEPQSYESTEGVQYVNTKSAMRLDRIVLYNATDYNSGKKDYAYSIRSIKFNYDYSLVPGTDNSFEITNPTAKFGKLTLLSVEFSGKEGKGSELIPPVRFEYDLESVSLGTALVTQAGSNGSSTSIAIPNGSSIATELEIGDLIRFNQNGKLLFAYVLSFSSGTVHVVVIDGDVTEGTITDIRETKNPPYHHDKYDIWNFYKVDVPSRSWMNDENTRRAVSNISSKSVDAWSLRRVRTSIGNTIEIDYESDDYGTVAVGAKYQFGIEQAYVKASDPNNVYVTLNYMHDVGSLFRTSDLVNLLLILNSETAECGEFLPNIYTYDNAQVVGINSEENALILHHDNPNFRIFVSLNNCNKSNFVAGHLGSNASIRRLGGGLRVKDIKLKTSSGIRKTSYTYTINGCNSIMPTSCTSAGVTTYEPYTFGTSIKSIVDYKLEHFYNHSSGYNASGYNNIFYNSQAKLLGLTRELPAPGVMYSEVKVSESMTHQGAEHIVPTHRFFEFVTFVPSMVQVVDVKPYTEEAVPESTYDNFVYTSVGLKDIAIKDYSSRIGNMKRVIVYNGLTKVSETENRYLHEESGDYDALLDTYQDQGVIQETFIDVKFQHHAKLRGVVSRRHAYPTILKEQISTNYLTNTKSSTVNMAFDFYSGVPSEVLQTDSYGNRFLSVTNAAYKQYSAMGLKIYDVHNKNMLTQTADEYSYIVNENNVPTGVLSAAVQTWSDDVPVLNLNGTQTNIWRKEAVYQWNGTVGLQTDGSYSYSDFSANPFNWQNPSANDRWEKTGEVTLYDIYSHGLEGKDINNNYAATRMSNDQMRVIASGTNARYDEIAYAGAEYYSGNSDNEGGVNRGEGNASRAHTHTGDFSLLVGSGKKGFNYTLSYGTADLNKKYKASVWVYAPGEAETQADLNTLKLYYSVNGKEIESVSPVLQKSKSKSWYLLSIDIALGGDDPVYIGVRNGSSRGVYFDDFRVHPLDGSLTSYVYDTYSGEIHYILDNNNFYIQFKYDARGRLVSTSKELLNFDYGDGKESFRNDAIVNEVKYNYKRGN